MSDDRQAPILSIQDLHKQYGEHHVLKGISLDVLPEELVFIIGPSGSGKSTLLRCCNVLETSTSGRILLDGKSILGKGVNLNTVRQQIGMVFQHFNLYPHMTVLDNITLALRKVKKKSKQQAHEKALLALRQVSLEDKADAYPDALSGGQQQRVAIARTIALDPKIILFDEPTSALDPELVGGVLDAMRTLKAAGMTMVVVSHEMGFARVAADRVIFMDNGAIVEQGSPQAIFEAPRHERLKTFLSSVLSHG
ncbi:amino acid ABC transporter ATP-binding protein [Castellaniella sp.]|uniref:amino acid ABC transporter ATP-binding protein n=1 Tax=Castellaniella sp. TaxID=1955812 RepID=UPI002AFF7547|nr:amino acid ABC transporter ATP-binding protein [Castellaniella sp.]